MNRRKFATGLLTVGAVAATAGFATAMAETDRSPAAGRAPETKSAATASSAAEEQGGVFKSISALNRSSTAGAEPAVARSQGVNLKRFAAFVESAVGEQVTEAKLLRTVGHASILVAATRGHVCLRYRTPGQQPDGSGGGGSMACSPVESATDASSPLAVYGEEEDGGFFTAVLLPDSVDDAAVDTARGEAQASVVSNVGFVRTELAPRALTWRTANGEVRRHTLAELSQPTR